MCKWSENGECTLCASENRCNGTLCEMCECAYVDTDEILFFEADDVNDPKWDVVINVLRNNIPGFEVRYAEGKWMNFVIPHTNTPE